MSCTFIAILAAGQSSRYKSNKLLEEFRGKPLVEHAIDAATRVSNATVHLIYNRDPDTIAAIAQQYQIGATLNPHAAQGLATSLRLAGQLATAAGARRLCILLGDMPFVSAEHVSNLCAKLDEGFSIVATGDPRHWTPPVVMGAEHIPLLATVEGDRGLKSLTEGGASLQMGFLFGGEANVDIDTVADFRRFSTEAVLV